jgi:hypothetical protein
MMPYKDPGKQKESQRQYYERNKEAALINMRASRLARKRWLDQLKQKPCLDCKLEWPSYVMEFHHRDPKLKVASLGRLLYNSGRDKILEEIEKCDLLCSNCHRIREHSENIRFQM